MKNNKKNSNRIYCVDNKNTYNYPFYDEKKEMWYREDKELVEKNCYEYLIKWFGILVIIFGIIMGIMRMIPTYNNEYTIVDSIEYIIISIGVGLLFLSIGEIINLLNNIKKK